MPSSSSRAYKYKGRGDEAERRKKQKGANNPSFRKAYRGTLLEAKYKSRGDEAERRKKQKGANNPSFRKAYRGTLLEENKNPESDERKHDEKLTLELSECLEECSQQRLRALHMSLRLYGNDESKISNKELVQSFQENGINIPGRLLRSLTAKFESPQGVDLEGTHRFLSDAHGKTGRDSVMAMHERNDLRSSNDATRDAARDVSQEEIDEDLRWRIESQLIRSHGYIDLDALRTDFQGRDVGKTSRLDFNLIKQICTDQSMPIYGALLKNLLKRCADRKHPDRVRWPDFLTFLEKAQASAWNACPSLKDMPQRSKVKTPVAPSPIDELPARARNALVNKIRKKSSLKRSEQAKKAEAANEKTDENQNKTDTTDSAGNKETKPEVETSTSPKEKDKATPTPESATKTAEKSDGTDNKESMAGQEPAKSQDKADNANTVGETASGDVKKSDTNTEQNKGDFTETIITVDKATPAEQERDKGTDNAHKDQQDTIAPITIRIEQASRDNTPIKASRDTTPIKSTRDNTPIKSPRDKTSIKNDRLAAANDDSRDAANKDADDNIAANTSSNDSGENGKNADSKGNEESVTDGTDDKVNAGAREEGDIAKGDTDTDGTAGANKEEDGERDKENENNDDTGKSNGEEEKPVDKEDTVRPEVTSLESHEVKVRGKSVQFDVASDFLDKQTTEPPAERLRLEWVYGYRGNDCRKNVHVLVSGEVVYFMSYVAVLLDRHTNRQRHYREHTDDIKCIDVHSDKVIVATGQYASRRNNMIQAHIRVWRSDTLQTLKVLGMGKFEKSVICMAFMPDQDMLAAVDNSLEKRLTVWNTATGELQGEELLHSDLVCDLCFNPRHPDTLVTIGKEHLCWWRVYPDNKLVHAWEKPDYNGFLRAKFVICMTFTERGDLVTGDSNGTIYVFGHGGNKVTNYVKHAHDGPVFTVLCYKSQILSGGRDGIIHCWQCNKNMDSTGFVQLPKSNGGIRMLRVSEWKLLVGTTMNSILAVNLAEGDAPLEGAQVDATPVTQCHYDELRGLTTLRNCPSDVITAGLDGIVCGFHTGSRRSVFKFQMKGNQYLCVDIDESGTFMALGTKDGHLQLLEQNAGTWDEVVNRKLSKERIDCVRISPDCTSVAAGSHDSTIYIFSRVATEENTLVWENAGKLKGHVGSIQAMDWSTKKNDDGYLLRSCSSNLELKYWVPSTLHSYDDAVTLSPRDWASQTTPVTPCTVGALTVQGPGDAEVLCLCVNKELTLTATGDNRGNVHLFRAPCSLSGVRCHSYKSHATVHSVRFTHCGKRLVTVGGRDSCMMQWEVV